MGHATLDDFDALFESAPLGIVAVDSVGQIVRVNPALEQMFGYSPGTLVGQPLELLLPEEVRVAHIAHRQGFVSAPRSRPMGQGLDLEGRRRDGQTFPIEVSLTQLPLGGQPLAVAFVADTSERKRLERERDRLLEHERQARTAAETAERRQTLLARASQLLAASPDYRGALEQVARLVLPTLGDACAIYLTEDAEPEQVALAFASSAKGRLGELGPRHAAWASLFARVAGGHSVLIGDVAGLPPDVDEGLGVWRDAGARALMIVPICLRGDPLGVLALAIMASGRGYGLADQGLAQELALDIGRSLANIRLFAQAQRAAEQQEAALALLHTIVQGAPIGLGFLDVGLRLQLLNAHLAELNGLAPEAHLGRSLGELVPDLGGQLEPVMRDVLASGEPCIDWEVSGLATAGGARQCLVSIYPVRTSAGSALGVGLVVQDVTTRRRAEEARARLAAIIDSSDDAIIGAALDETIFAWNTGAERLYGYSAAEMIGGQWSLIMPADRRHELKRISTIVSRGESVSYVETERLHKSGRRIEVSLTYSPIIDALGAVIGISATARDIGERRRVERLLVRQARLSRLLQIVAEAANAGSVRDALQTTVDAICGEIGWPVGHAYLAQEGAGNPLASTDIWHLDRPARFATFKAITDALTTVAADDLPGRVMLSGQPEWITDLDARQQRPRFSVVSDLGVRSGFAFPVLVGAEVAAVLEFFATEQQPPDEILLEVMANVGSQLGRTIERDRAERALRKSEQLYRTLASSIPNGSVLLFDRQLRYTIADGSALAASGHSREQVEGRTLHEVLSPESAARLEPMYLAALRGERGELEVAARDRIFISHFLPVKGERGEIMAGMVMSYDVTELKRVERELREERELLARRVAERTADLSLANAELARAARLKDEFLANMSHELRTPLNAILGRAEALQEAIYGPVTPKQLEVLRGIEESGQHLLSLINDILDLSKIEAGRIELGLEPVDVELICRISLRMVAQLALMKRVSVTLSTDSLVTTIPADERRLKQILVNLLSNAVKFTPSGGSVGLEVRGDAERKTATFTVWDTGIGIAKEHLPRLFRPFVQIDSSLSRQYAGTGLGLALVLRLTEAHGGSVGLESVPGAGSRFSVTLPWSGPEGSGSRSVNSATPAYPTLRQVLVVEDSATSAGQIMRYLHELGVQVELHTLAGGTLERAVALQPDAIFLDILLPDQSGWEVLEALKSEPRTQAIPVVVFSVIDEPARAFSLGAVGFLLKPLSRAMLAQTFRQLVRSQAERPAPQAASKASPTRPPRILLAEDNQANIDVLSDYLQGRGYEVLVARNGAEAIVRAEEEQVDVILMDIQMPGMDGLEAISRLRAQPQTQDLRIIALTALAMPGDRERCLEAGANSYLPKPVNLRSLLEVIEAQRRR